MQHDPCEQQRQHDEDEERRQPSRVALHVRQRHRQQQRQHQNDAVGEIGDEALHHAEVEGRKHIADQEQVQGAEQRADHTAAPTGQAGAAQHQRGHGDQRVGCALCRVARADQRGVAKRGQADEGARDAVRADAHEADAHATGVGGALVRAHQAQVAVERRAREEQPGGGAHDQNQQHGREKGVAQAPGQHPLRCRAAWPGQDHEVDARQREVAAECHDDGLHAHEDDHQRHQQLIRHADRDDVREHRQRRADEVQTIELHQRHVDEPQQWADREVNRAAPRHRRCHQPVGGQHQRRGHEHGAANAGAGDQAGAAQHGGDQQREQHQDRHQQVSAGRLGGQGSASVGHGVAMLDSGRRGGGQAAGGECQVTPGLASRPAAAARVDIEHAH